MMPKHPGGSAASDVPGPPRGVDYYRDLADEYDRISRGVPGDIEFYVGLTRGLDGAAVELGAGTGRITIPIAQAGAKVIGIDREPAMLAIVRAKAAHAGVLARLDLREGDMRSFVVDEPVSLILIPHRTFLHNLTVTDQEGTLAACRRALRPGGRLALNVFNPDLALIARHMQAPAQRWKPFGQRASDSGDGTEPAQARYAYERESPLVTTTVRARDASGRWRRTSFTLRYIHRAEMEVLFARAGFTVDALYGGFAGEPFEVTSPEMVWVVRADRAV